MKKRKTTTMKKTRYHRLTDKQLVSLIRKWQKNFASLAKTPEWKTVKGWTPKQRRAAFRREFPVLAAVLRFKILQKIDQRIVDLKTQLARQYGVSVNSPIVTNAAIKRLLAKRKQILGTKNHLTLATTCAALKLASYKNPTIRVTKAKRKVAKISKGKKRNAFANKVIKAKFVKQTKTLKKEIKKLKQRNSLMRSQVAKFRREAAQMQRHYGTLNSTKPRLSLVSNKNVKQDVSNIIRLSNALRAVYKQPKVS
jgi:hypothetical protein